MGKKITSFLTALLILGFGGWQWIESTESAESPTEVRQKQQTVENVDLSDPPRFEKLLVSSLRSVDGDTFAFYIDHQEYKVRLLMVDTPESVKKETPVQPFGKEASEFTKEQLANHSISLVFDQGEVADRYGRLLAYVYIDDVSLQELLLQNGLGIVRYVNEGGDSYVEEFLQAQATAQSEKIGVWQEEGYVVQMKNGYYRYNEIQE
ncbi:thermonuclease family protein [Enterococcus olivae]